MAFPKAGKNKAGEPAKRPSSAPLKKADILMLIHRHRGNVSKVADALGCHRCTITAHANADPEIKEALTQARERWIDDIEDSVLSRAHESNDTALQCFVLKTQARHRGWDQDEVKNSAKDIATAAFDFILNKSKNPAE